MAIEFTASRPEDTDNRRPFFIVFSAPPPLGEILNANGIRHSPEREHS
jgi:hypothetical protein